MFGARLTDFSKLLIVYRTIYVYRFEMKALEFIYNYIRNRKKRTKIEMHIAPGKTYYIEFLKSRFWGLYYLIKIYAFYFL